MAFKQNDSPLYFRAAREAVQLEQAGEFDRAAKVWAKASRLSRNGANQQWSENRCDFCLMQIGRDKLKEAVSDGLHP